MLWKKESNRNNALYVDLCAASNIIPDLYDVVRATAVSNTTKKDNGLAKEYRIKGNGEFAVKKWRTAMDFYNQSLGFAENGTELISLAYANRSACFFQLKIYEKCLVDIELAIKSNYPERLMPKLKQRRADCLKSIKSGKSIKTFLPELSFSADLKFPCMANVLQIERGGQFCRFIKAKRNIDAGQVILVEDGFVKSFSSDYHSACAICLSAESNLIPCNKCATALFCHGKCENNFLHSIECEMVKLPHDDEGSDAPIIRSILVTMQIIPNGKELMSFVERVMQSDPSEIPESIVEPQEKYRAFLKRYQVSQPDVPDIFKSMVIKMIYETLLGNTAVKAYFATKMQQRFLTHLICHHFNIVDSFPWSTDVCIQPLIGSYFGHSCAPNTIVIQSHGYTIVVTSRPISTGEPMTISYCFDMNKKSNAERQSYLQSKYGFTCACERCKLSGAGKSSQIKDDPLYGAICSDFKKTDDQLLIASNSSLIGKCEQLLNKYHDVKWSDEIGVVQSIYSVLWTKRADGLF